MTGAVQVVMVINTPNSNYVQNIFRTCSNITYISLEINTKDSGS